jgi:hypothetical protein
VGGLERFDGLGCVRGYFLGDREGGAPGVTSVALPGRRTRMNRLIAGVVLFPGQRKCLRSGGCLLVRLCCLLR